MENNYNVYVKDENDNIKLYLKNLTEKQAIEESNKYYKEFKMSAIILKEDK